VRTEGVTVSRGILRLPGPPRKHCHLTGLGSPGQAKPGRRANEHLTPLIDGASTLPPFAVLSAAHEAPFCRGRAITERRVRCVRVARAGRVRVRRSDQSSPGVPEPRGIGRVTLGENVADLGGLRLAYRAYRATGGDERFSGSFDAEQQFFLAYAQLRCESLRDETLETRLAYQLDELGVIRDSRLEPRKGVQGPRHTSAYSHEVRGLSRSASAKFSSIRAHADSNPRHPVPRSAPFSVVATGLAPCQAARLSVRRSSNAPPTLDRK